MQSERKFIVIPLAILDSLALSLALLLTAFSDVYEGKLIPWKGDFCLLEW